MAATLMCKYCGHANIQANNIAPMFKSTLLQRHCAQYVSSKVPEKVVRAGTSSKKQLAVRSNSYLRFKVKMKRQMEEARKSILVNIPDRQVQKPEKLTDVKKLIAFHGQIVSVVPVSHCSYLMQFEEGEIPHRQKLLGAGIFMPTKKMSKPTSSVMSESGNLTDCIHKIYTSRKLSETEVKVNFFIASYLSSLFKLKADNEVVPFGSTASGLGLTGYSDLDIVWTQSWQQNQDSSLHRAELSRASFLLKRQKLVITRLIPILHASTPILQFEFKPLGVSCDLSRGSFSGVLMAEILCWLNEYDERFYKLVLVLKLLFKVHRVVGGGGTLVSSNTLVMLVIAFLQQRNILPPLKHVFDFKFQNCSTWSSTLLNECRPKLLYEMDDTDLGTLFQEFLVFYGTKNFQEYHIDVFHGTIARPGRTYKPLTLPNPFDFDFNMARSVKEDALASFRTQCCDTLARINKTKCDNFQSLWNPDAKK